MEKVGTLIGRTFKSLEEIAIEIEGWGWERKDPKEWPGYNYYHWHHPKNCDSILVPDEIKISLKNFLDNRKWPIHYHNLNHGAHYSIAQIEVSNIKRRKV